MKSWVLRATRSLEWIAGYLFLTLFVLNILRIFLRYFLGAAWLWEPDLSRLLFIWIVFLGATVLYVGGGHLVVDLLLTRLEPKTRARAHFLIDAVTAIFLLVLVLKGVEVTRVRMRIPFDTWDLPTGYAYMAVPISALLMILGTIMRMAEHLWKRRER